MSIVIFRNHDKKAIKELLKEIGKERYENALKDAGLDKQPPIGMDGFYIEYKVKTHEVDLYYRYPSNTKFYIMSVLGFWLIPENGWQYHRAGTKR
ncbi:hypothetical protein [Maribacter sp. 2-571]|uniref:hypothetical protein n=1 Tax=Maribacter sp. 2-571 TaxID=3417569 RepID=UPI003D346F9D